MEKIIARQLIKKADTAEIVGYELLVQSDEESLLQVKSEADQALENKIQIVKFIVQVKQAEAAERLAAKDKKERNQKIMRIIERKQNEALEGKSLEELTAMLEE